MATTSVKTQILDEAAVRGWEQHVLDTLHRRMATARAWRQSIASLDEFLEGNWVVTFPGGRTVVDRPRIDNRPKNVIEDVGAQAGEVDPSVRVDPPKRKGDTGKPKALRRERVCEFYLQNSKFSVQRIQLYMDLVATGVMAVKVWPDFTSMPDERFPLIERVDPRHLWIDPTHRVGKPADNVIVEKVVKLRELQLAFPEAAAHIASFTGASDAELGSEDVKVVEFWSKRRIVHIAMIEGNRESIATLVNVENRAGVNPLVVGVRPSADGLVQSHVKDMLSQVAAENRLMTYLLDYADQMVFAPIGKKGDVANAEHFGPGAIIDLGERGEVVRIAPAQANPQIFSVIGNLNQSSRDGSFYPRARSGTVTQSIASAAAIESMQGSLGTFVRTCQSVGEEFIHDILVAAQKVDKTYCDTEKSVRGHHRGGSFSETYTPSALLNDTSVRVEYGLQGGATDAFNLTIRLMQVSKSGLASKMWAMENMPGIEDPIQEKNRMFDEQVEQAILAGALANANAGNLAPLAELQEARKAGRDPLEAIKAMVEKQIQPLEAQPAEAGGNPLAEAAAIESESRSLEKGGIPNQAGGAGGTPELSSLMAV